eukprot:CAMPEP_0201944838 /NCGR_PEP_ID=MMETSP0903-20130614/53596_1 /ASSEMBLY_ACC=CAM_ASM_000552 /TAXON_ID=420261 /ORGANISM="Thalassiosira antarctica, Strain CCMP982" /LENGTH=944 /DNA_ID=CAMNT_0048487893 /DNA_START=264 /DNA_END=3100 /DNA_ORIENTATION=-
MSGQGGKSRSIESRVKELEDFCASDALSLDAARENHVQQPILSKMSGQGGKSRSIESRVKELEDFCASKALSLDALRKKIKKIKLIPPTSTANAIRDSTFLHRACMNKRVTLEIIVCLLDAFPWATDRTTMGSYPLHLACRNASCSMSIIQLLAKKNPSALRHSSPSREFSDTLPLYCYLRRRSNMDLDTVKILVDAYPEALATANGDWRFRFTPLHVLLANPSIADCCDIVQFLVEAEPSSLQLNCCCDGVPLHVACLNVNTNLKIVQILLHAWPEATRSRDDRDSYWKLPIHIFCQVYRKMDETTSLGILILLVITDPQTVEEPDRYGELPIHSVLRHSKKSLEFCKILISAFPDSMRVETDNGELPIHLACRYGHLDTVKYLSKLHPDSVRVGTRNGELPIHEACGGRLEIVKYLSELYPDSVRVGTDDGALPIHLVCIYGHLETVKYLLELYPESITMRDQEGYSPLHRAASNCKEKAGEVIRFLLSRDSTCASMVTATHTFLPLGLPLHVAGYHLNLDAVQLLFDAHPEAICVNDGNGRTLLDIAGMPRLRGRGEENASEVVTFLEAQMAYVRKAQDIIAMQTPDDNNRLPLHHALFNNASLGAIKGHLETVKYLLELYPESITMRDQEGYFPLHRAASNCKGEAGEIIRFLLSRDSAGASMVTATNANAFRPLGLPLHVAGFYFNLDAVQLLFDVHPEAICINDGMGRTPLDITRQSIARGMFRERGRGGAYEVLWFLEAQMAYVRQAQDIIAMQTTDDNNGSHSTMHYSIILEAQMAYVRQAQDIIAMQTTDDNNRLPLHHALFNNASLGAIKLLVKGNPLAVQVSDRQRMLPLHIACELSTVEVVKFLVELKDFGLDHCDVKKDSPLHYACRGGNCGTVKYLLERSASQVSERNVGNKLPIHLLCESGTDKVDRESPEFVETIWHLLKAHHETVLI